MAIPLLHREKFFMKFNIISVNCIYDTQFRVNEGELRVKQLEQFIENHKTVKKVWLLEDGTAIVPTIKYDSKTNQLVGILLPTNSNGCPLPLRYILIYVEYKNVKN